MVDPVVKPLTCPPAQDTGSPPGGPGDQSWQVLCVPAFADNYLWLIHDATQAVAVDPGDAQAIIAALDARGLTLSAILCTHHHADHVGGVLQLIARYGAIPVYGPAHEAIPGRTVAVRDAEVLTLPPGDFRVLEVPGHTAGHVAYVWEDRLFCGDTLFALGCGRVFEGTPAQMLDSLERLSSLTGDLWVHCAHEYTLSNLAFALQVDGENGDLQARATRERARRSAGLATVPSRMSDERRTNPFLRCGSGAVKASAETWRQAPLDTRVAVFTALREWKNGYRA